MTDLQKKEMSAAIIEKALDLGASLAGIANVEELKNAPSYVFAPKLPQGDSVANRESNMGLKPGEVAWPEGGKSALIVAVEHPESKPELDWWENRKATPGNTIMMKIRIISIWSPSPTGASTITIPTVISPKGLMRILVKKFQRPDRERRYWW